MTHPHYDIRAAQAVRAHLERGGAIKLGDGQGIESIAELGAAAILDTPELSPRAALERSLATHLRRIPGGVYDTYESAWNDAITWEQARVKRACVCGGLERVETEDAGWVRCPTCCPDPEADPNEGELGAARWIGRAIAFLQGHQSTDANRMEMIEDAKRLWDGAMPWDEAIKRARCVCGRTKAQLLSEGHAPDCPHDPDRAPSDA